MTEPIRYALGEIPDPEQLHLLFEHAAPGSGRTGAELHSAVKQSSWVATAWEGDRLVGLVRVLSDFVYVAYLQELLVHADYHHQGVGKELLDRYDHEFENFPVQVSIPEEEWVRKKLDKRGFHAEPSALSRKRAWNAP
jgi:GNAT superfamily N-acetyltransferase